MKSNGLLKWLMIPVAALALFVGYKWIAGSGPPANETSPTEVHPLTAAEMKALGIEGDTPRDTVATLVGEVKQLRGQLQSAVEDNKQQKTENERLRGREASVDQRIQAALTSERERAQQERETSASEREQTQSLLQDLQRRLDGLSEKGQHADLPIGLGLEDSDGESSDDTHLRWIEPLSGPGSGSKRTSKAPPAPNASELPIGFGAAEPASNERDTESASDSQAKNRPERETDARPVYTIPANATLVGSTAMTALIGRVPIDGTVNDPYPFKVLIGAENLTANGIELPDVAGAIASGTASGDWNLSCVRGQIRSITFVFQDGTVRTISEESAGKRRSSSTFQDGLGWISDPYGLPCVSGVQRSNAREYVTSQMLITAAGAGAASLIDSNSANVSYITGSNGNTLGTVGITGNEALGRILAGGVQEMSQWVNKLYGQAFAAVYVQPNAKVAIHLEQPLEIDYEPHGRKVNHTLGESHAADLD